VKTDHHCYIPACGILIPSEKLLCPGHTLATKKMRESEPQAKTWLTWVAAQGKVNAMRTELSAAETAASKAWAQVEELLRWP
jgi:hypothetical protein